MTMIAYLLGEAKFRKYVKAIPGMLHRNMVMMDVISKEMGIMRERSL